MIDIARTHTGTDTHTRTHTRTHTQTHFKHIPLHLNTHTLTQPPPQTHKHTQPQPHTHTHTPTHTHTHTHSHTRTNTWSMWLRPELAASAAEPGAVEVPAKDGGTADQVLEPKPLSLSKPPLGVELPDPSLLPPPAAPPPSLPPPLAPTPLRPKLRRPAVPKPPKLAPMLSNASEPNVCALEAELFMPSKALEPNALEL